MTTILRIFPLKVWIGIGVVALILALYGAYRFQEARANRAVAEARTATATADALDKVATETTDIRQDQQEKSRAVEEIKGSDTRLPDGYGRELERLRNNGDRNPR
jgi:hypothetical protein